MVPKINESVKQEILLQIPAFAFSSHPPAPGLDPGHPPSHRRGRSGLGPDRQTDATQTGPSLPPAFRPPCALAPGLGSECRVRPLSRFRLEAANSFLTTTGHKRRGTPRGAAPSVPEMSKPELGSRQPACHGGCSAGGWTVTPRSQVPCLTEPPSETLLSCARSDKHTRLVHTDSFLPWAGLTSFCHVLVKSQSHRKLWALGHRTLAAVTVSVLALSEGLSTRPDGLIFRLLAGYCALVFSCCLSPPGHTHTAVRPGTGLVSRPALLSRAVTPVGHQPSRFPFPERFVHVSPLAQERRVTLAPRAWGRKAASALGPVGVI